MRKSSTIFIALLCGICCAACGYKNAPDAVDLKGEMRKLVMEISAKAKGIKTDFIILPQNGVELLSSTGELGGTADLGYLAAIDAVNKESFQFQFDGKKIDNPIIDEFRSYLELAKGMGLPIFTIDYCTDKTKVDDSYDLTNSLQYVGFAGDAKFLNNIPSYPATPNQVNDSMVTDIKHVHNALYMLTTNAAKYPTKQRLVDAVRQTNYDMLVTDLYFNDRQPFTADQVQAMRDKKNGGKRLVLAYMSIGEAENYRPYWQDGWHPKNPDWLRGRNTQWGKNYLVHYWDPGWKKIMYQDDDSYLNRIIDAGFDGVFLDKVDAFDDYRD